MGRKRKIFPLIHIKVQEEVFLILKEHFESRVSGNAFIEAWVSHSLSKHAKPNVWQGEEFCKIEDAALGGLFFLKLEKLHVASELAFSPGWSRK